MFVLASQPMCTSSLQTWYPAASQPTMLCSLPVGHNHPWNQISSQTALRQTPCINLSANVSRRICTSLSIVVLKKCSPVMPNVFLLIRRLKSAAHGTYRSSFIFYNLLSMLANFTLPPTTFVVFSLSKPVVIF